MNYKKLIGYGVIIWAVAYLVASLFVAYKSASAILMNVAVLIVVATVTAWLGSKIHQPSAAKVLMYSAGWVVIGLILDIIFTVPFTGWMVFGSWGLWGGYILVLIVPLLTNKRPTDSTA